MLYQKLLAGTVPYHLDVSDCSEIELNYCINGTYKIFIGQNEYVLNEGDLAIVGPMTPHQLKPIPHQTGKRLTIEAGPTLLGEHFRLFVSINPKNALISLKQKSELKSLLDETVTLLTEKPPLYNLSAKGNIYKISAAILNFLSINSDKPEVATKSLIDVEKIGRAINLIYNQYDAPLSLDYVSDYCGYSKSNFCKTFKEVTGKSFHSMHNHHRIDIACSLLLETAASIEDIALTVGFADSKSFCRTFKNVMGTNAGEYRKNAKKSK